MDANQSGRRSGQLIQELYEIDGLEEILEKLDIENDDIAKAASEAVEASAYRILTAARKKLHEGGKTGRIYQKYQPRRTHQASAPGEPAASDTGKTAKSLRVKAKGLDAEVFSKLKVALYMEFGTATIAPRPFLFPAAEEDTPKLIKELKGLIK